jgi:putative PIN family toxin of toxin-antitoxin system
VARPKVVFDTNVFVRALINPKGINARLILSLSRYVLVTSVAIVEEVAEVLARPGVLDDTAIRKLDVERVLELLRRAPMVSPATAVTVCRDPDDNKFLEEAIVAGAAYLVTSDKDLRDLGEYEGVKIRLPVEFLRELGE